MIIGDKIAELRKEKGLTQEQLSGLPAGGRAPTFLRQPSLKEAEFSRRKPWLS